MAEPEARGLAGTRGLSVAAVITRLWDARVGELRFGRRCSVNQRCAAPFADGLLRVGGKLRELRIEIGERSLQLFAVTWALAGLQLFFDARA